MQVAFMLHRAPSHHYASYQLAGRLQDQGYEIIYIEVNENNIASIQSNGFAVRVSEEMIFESTFHKHCNDPRELKRLFVKDHLNAIFNGAIPDFVILDNPLLHYGLLLQKAKIPFIALQVFVPMERSKNTPPINALFIPKKHWFSHITCNALWLGYRWRRFISEAPYYMRIGLLSEKHLIQSMKQKSKVHNVALTFQKSLHVGLKKITELVLAPEELNFPGIDSSHKIYIPYTKQSIERVENKYSGLYKDDIDKIKSHRCVIFCSMGTMPEKHYVGYNDFLQKLSDGITELPKDTALVIATGNTAKIRSDQDNVFTYKSVPQLEVLEYCDLMITHAGINSVKECIAFEVPMLAVPLSDWLDQKGNAARIKYHMIGDLLDIRKRYTTQSIYQKISNLLHNKVYQRNISTMKKAIEKRAASFDYNLLTELIRVSKHA